MSISTFILIFMFLCWSVLISIYINFTLSRKLAYLKSHEAQFSKSYPAFTRNDRRNWNYLEMTLVGIFVFPIRLILTLSTILSVGILVKIATFFAGIKNHAGELPKSYKNTLNWIVNCHARFLMILLGFYKPKTVKLEYKNQNRYLKSFPGIPTAINVCNHVSFVDIIYFLSADCTGFIAKSGVRQIPLVGNVAQSIQCLFVERQNKNSKVQIFEKLGQRVEDVQQGKQFNGLTVFPEGTTTNNRGLLDFRKGAFAALTPIRIFGLKYISKFHPMLLMINMFDCFMGISLQWSNSLTVYQFVEPVGPAEGVSVEVFSEQVKLLMCDQFGFENYHNTFEEKILFEQKECGFKAEAYK